MQKKKRTTFSPLPVANVFGSTAFGVSQNGFHQPPPAAFAKSLTSPEIIKQKTNDDGKRSQSQGQGQPQQLRPRLSTVSKTCVTFQKETDGRSNFPNQRDFQDFCKQRDLFYGIKEIWTLKQSEPARPPPPNFTSSQPYDPAFGKMRALFQLNSSPTNLSRLAALFLSQCVLDSAYSSNQVGSGGGPTTTTAAAETNVRRILQSNPSKLEQLKQRVAPPEASVDFAQISDPMGFLKYFLSSVHVPSSFSQYLMDRAVLELTEVEQSAELLDEKEVLDTMRKSRLLAKMLGHLFFAPYRQLKPQNSASQHYENQVSLRAYQSPPLDLFAILRKALRQNRIVFTLPWILEFLAQADQATFYLPAYAQALGLISSIYQEILHSNSSCIGNENRTFLRLYCDSLFEHQGSSCFFKKQQSPGGNTNASVLSIAERNHQKIHDNENEQDPLDKRDSIGATLNPLCFRIQQKEKQNENENFSMALANDGGQPVDPFALPFPDRTSAADAAKSSIQTELETQFFQMYPPSMKKTVDFISERVASNFVKKLRAQTLLDLKKGFSAKSIWGESAVRECKLVITSQRDEFINGRVRSTVELLLETGIEQVQSICWKICERKAGEKINEWVGKHVTAELFPQVMSRIEEESEEPQTQSLPPQSPKKNAYPIKTSQTLAQVQVETPFEIFRLLHNCSQKLQSGEPVNPNDLREILNDEGLQTQKPWLTKATIGVAIELAAFQPRILKETMSNFLEFWAKCPCLSTTETENDDEEGGMKVLCPRNLMLLQKSQNVKETWEVMEELLKNLLKARLVSSEELETECMELLRVDWPEEFSQNISCVLRSALNSLPHGVEDSQVIDWVAWYCSPELGDEDGN